MTQRVLQIIPTLVRGGAEKQLSLLARNLPRDQFETHVCVLTHSGPLEAELQQAEIPLHHIGKRWKVDPLAYWKLRRLIRSLKPDIVHTWLFAANSYGRQAAIGERVPCVIGGERCADPWKVWHELAIDRRLAKKTRTIVTNSEAVVDFYQSQGFPSELFTVIPNGIDPFPPVEITREELLSDLLLPPDAKLIVTIGRLWPQKRLKDLIWAGDLLKCIRPDCHLLIVGDGPQRSRLQQYTRQVEVDDRVHFLGHSSEVNTLLKHADFFWLGSQYEGQSNAIMEAMSAGVPVIATDIPGNRDLVEHEETGMLVPVGDRAAFARHTNLLLDDHQRSQQLGEAGRQRIAGEFTSQKMVQAHAELYQRLLET